MFILRVTSMSRLVKTLTVCGHVFLRSMSHASLSRRTRGATESHPNHLADKAATDTGTVAFRQVVVPFLEPSNACPQMTLTHWFGSHSSQIAVAKVVTGSPLSLKAGS